MKIVFTATNSSEDCEVDTRFGRARFLVSYDEETQKKEFFSNEECNDLEHGAGLKTIQKVMDMKPDLIITGNAIGNKTLKVIKNTDIKVYVGADHMSLEDAYAAYKNDKLRLQ